MKNLRKPSYTKETQWNPQGTLREPCGELWNTLEVILDLKRFKGVKGVF